jgi:hypothetical protein
MSTSTKLLAILAFSPFRALIFTKSTEAVHPVFVRQSIPQVSTFLFNRRRDTPDVGHCALDAGVLLTPKMKTLPAAQRQPGAFPHFTNKTSHPSDSISDET